MCTQMVESVGSNPTACKQLIGVCVFGCILGELGELGSSNMESTRMDRNKS